FFMTSFLRWKPFSQVSTGPKITGQVTGRSAGRRGTHALGAARNAQRSVHMPRKQKTRILHKRI
ncbi:hypothetical protein, partial [Burkholderia gladioli]